MWHPLSHVKLILLFKIRRKGCITEEKTNWNYIQVIWFFQCIPVLTWNVMIENKNKMPQNAHISFKVSKLEYACRRCACHPVFVQLWTSLCAGLCNRSLNCRKTNNVASIYLFWFMASDMNCPINIKQMEHSIKQIQK